MSQSQSKTPTPGMDDYNLSVQEALNTPFPKEWVDKKKTFVKGQSTGEVDFVPWYRYAERLNTLAPNSWSMRVTHVEIVGDKLLLVVEVGVRGAYKAGTGAASADKDTWGGAHAEAFSQAFRRACAAHGLGLYLYRDEESDTAPSNDDGLWPSEEQRKRLRGLFETGVFEEGEISRWRESLKSLQTRPNFGRVIREMKDRYEEKKGSPYPQD